MRPFGKAKSISGYQTLQLMRRPCGVKGSVYVVTLPAFQRCPEDGPRRSRATARERIPHRQEDRRRPSQGTSRPTGNTGETWEGNPTGSQRIHSTCSLPDFI
ncbi:OLC1v1016295C1 [Oldenlandia corymbosa var. corymbosa]|uniref:OLC1v1016295C1 n=1 Tax=Oldenlandia corymbosa var. corymbosa TaxID=529605 RepID=A0AAV1E6U4_OLDCO|nr:OLC1v1016295C1 [Oldenlandia corymbosa var. corymbosa]